MRIIVALLILVIPASLKAQFMGGIKSTVAFIYVENKKDIPQANGTCFFIGLPRDSTTTYPYLVTAKHVLQKKDGTFYPFIKIRMNTLDSSSNFTYMELITQGPDKNVYVHPDSSVDVAVIPYAPPNDNYDFHYLGTDFLRDRKEFDTMKVVEGTEVFFTGLFSPYTGERKIYPIVRFGRIALLTDEKIDFFGKKREMFLIETSSYGGNSGSPVYFKVGDLYQGYQLILGGVLNGTYRDFGEITFVETAASTPYAIYNNGISSITPVYILREILYSEELNQRRKKARR